MRLKDQRDLLLRLVIANTHRAFLASLCNGGQHVRDLFEEMKNPRPGDWVIEQSTIYMEERDALRFGKFLRVEERPLMTVEQWEEEWKDYPAHERDPIPKGKFWILEMLDGTEKSWENCSFIKVLTDRGRL